MGGGTDLDMVKALKRFVRSARARNKDAASYSQKAGRFLSRDMQREARSKALEWQNSHAKKASSAK